MAWITERKNVLSGVFYLASVYAYLRSAGLGGRAVDEHRATRLYAFSLVCFAAALLSKTVTGSLPAVVLLLVWWRRGRVGWSDVQPLIPYFLLAAGFGLLTARLETQHVGAVGWEWDLSTASRVLIAGRALWFYAGKLVWPTQLSFNYPRFEIDSGDFVAWLYPIAAVVVVLSAWVLRARFGRGPLVAVLVFAGSLFPALGSSMSIRCGIPSSPTTSSTSPASGSSACSPPSPPTPPLGSSGREAADALAGALFRSSSVRVSCSRC